MPLILCAILVPDARAFYYSLSSEQVREAYFVGRDVERRQSFFSKYIHFPELAEKGPDIQLIEFRTPYEQVALRSQERWANYDAPTAEEDYAAQPDQVFVRVSICSTQTLSFAMPPPGIAPGKGAPWRDEDYLRGFEFRVSQVLPIKAKELTVKRADLVCAEFGGFEAILHFGADQFTSATTKVEVVAPDKQIYQTTSDLDELQ